MRTACSGTRAIGCRRQPLRDTVARCRSRTSSWRITSPLSSPGCSLLSTTSERGSWCTSTRRPISRASSPRPWTPASSPSSSPTAGMSDGETSPSSRQNSPCCATPPSTRPATTTVLLSGVDYPIRPAHELLAELESGATYMNSWQMPSPERGKPMDRLEYFWWAPKKRDNPLAHLINHKLFPRLPKRNVTRGLGGRQPFGGSQWWALPASVAVAVLDFADRETRFGRFFAHSHIRDEMFFQTIVAALHEPVELRRGLTFADWSRPEGGGGSPAILGSNNLAMCAAAGRSSPASSTSTSTPTGSTCSTGSFSPRSQSHRRSTHPPSRSWQASGQRWHRRARRGSLATASVTLLGLYGGTSPTAGPPVPRRPPGRRSPWRW